MADRIIINSHKDCLTQGFVAQNTVKIHPAESTANTRSNVYGEIRVVFEILNIRYISNILYQINLSTLQCHGLGRSITHIHQFYFVIRNFLAVVRIRYQIIAYTYTVESLDHVWTGSDGAIVKILCICHIHDCHGRMCQLSRKVCIGLCCLDRQGICLIICSNGCLKLQVFLWFCRTARSHFFQIFKTLFYLGRGQIASI